MRNGAGSWYGYVTACRGFLLLGGTKHHESARFETAEMASSWVSAIVKGNCEAHRQISAWGTAWSPLNAEIKGADGCGGAS